MDIKSLLSNFPWVSAIPEKTSYNFFRERDIRKVRSYEWRVLLDRHITGGDLKPFYNVRDEYFYMVPFYLEGTYHIEYLIGLTKDLKPLREAGKDPFPYGLSSVSKSRDIHILSTWEDYFSFYKKDTIPEKSAIILDRYVHTQESSSSVLEEAFWVSLLRGKNLILEPSENLIDYREAKDILRELGLSFIDKGEPIIEKKVEVVELVPEKKVEVVELVPKNGELFLNKAKLASYLRDKGVHEATFDTIRRIPDLVKVPFIIESKTNIKLYSSSYFEFYFQHKKKGLSRKEAAEKALEDYKVS